MKNNIAGFEAYYMDTDSIYMGIVEQINCKINENGEKEIEKIMRKEKISNEEFNSFNLEFSLPLDNQFRRIPATRY